MKKEWLLLSGVIIGTLTIALLVIRWLAPGLLGLPTDLQLVQVSKTLPPFYQGVFRKEDLQSNKFILQDPYTRVRAKPLTRDLFLGPNDILGFRNYAVPNVADVITIGDSQTYGNNAVLGENWPSQMQNMLATKGTSVYSMATGGWGAVQYLDMFINSAVFEPRVVIIAFYTGNDSLESFQMAYSVDHWAALRPDPALGKSDGPSITFPAPENEQWPVTFKDGVHTIFTPTLRLGANLDHPAVNAGYAIMAGVVNGVSDAAKRSQLQLVFTIIPTKELVYSLKVTRDKLKPPADYLALLEREQHNIEQLSASMRNLPNAVYVDVITPLQQAALGNIPLYPQDINGHPVAEGYEVIADAIARKVKNYVFDRPGGLVAIQRPKDKFIFALINGDGVWPFASKAIIRANGWPLDEVQGIQLRDIAGLRWHRSVNSVDPGRFGPGSVAGYQQTYHQSADSGQNSAK